MVQTAINISYSFGLSLMGLTLIKSDDVTFKLPGNPFGDRRRLLDPSSHVAGEDDAQIVVDEGREQRQLPRRRALFLSNPLGDPPPPPPLPPPPPYDGGETPESCKCLYGKAEDC